MRASTHSLSKGARHLYRASYPSTILSMLLLISLLTASLQAGARVEQDSLDSDKIKDFKIDSTKDEANDISYESLVNMPIKNDDELEREANLAAAISVANKSERYRTKKSIDAIESALSREDRLPPMGPFYLADASQGGNTAQKNASKNIDKNIDTTKAAKEISLDEGIDKGTKADTKVAASEPLRVRQEANPNANKSNNAKKPVPTKLADAPPVLDEKDAFIRLHNLLSQQNLPPLIVMLETSIGNIKLRLMPEVAPKAVKNFLALVLMGAYNDLPFHRVIKNFMIQSGDLVQSKDARYLKYSSSIYNSVFVDEIRSGVGFEEPGMLAMANRGPNSNTTQFFITVASTPWLDGHYSIFGQVIAGEDIAKRISEVPTDFNDTPKKEIRIIRAYMIKHLQ